VYIQDVYTSRQPELAAVQRSGFAAPHAQRSKLKASGSNRLLGGASARRPIAVIAWPGEL
jgi:hypothetical protein